MNALYMAHSGLRYLVLLSALGAIVVIAQGMAAKGPLGRPAKIALSSFMGFAQLQGLIGIVLVILRPWYSALMGHVIMMFLAIAAGQTLTSWAKKEKDDAKAHKLALAAVCAALLLILGGIMAIRPSPFAHAAF